MFWAPVWGIILGPEYLWTGPALAALIGYLLGSIPFGVILTRLGGAGDLRQVGSGNIGATNVLRTGRKDLALATLILDSGKGAAAVLLMMHFGREAMMAAAVGSVLGHLFPVWLRFKGGKGVATTLGVLLALAPLAGIGACLTWAATAALFRISSLSALMAMLAAPFFAAYWYGVDMGLVIAAIAALVWYRHKANIVRILKGEEPKIGKKHARSS